MSLLKITNLHARIEGEGREILKGINLEINPGEVHAIMGVNGSGKSTLANILGGRDGYEVTAGTVSFRGKDLLELDPEVRAREGLFLAFQYPVELPGVLTSYFLRTALNSVREHRGEAAMGVREFAALLKEKAQLLELGDEMLKRAVNEGFSGGEKKRNEVLQMAVLEPKLAILDETDSGLDIDALQIVANGVNRLRSKESGMLVITHYQRLLNYIVPDVVHVMIDGQIVQSGGKELALELESKGYNAFRPAA
jgi:Fe-S cluster assembly ATP-binding protein